MKWDLWIAELKRPKRVESILFSSDRPKLVSLGGCLEQECTPGLYTLLLLCFLQAVLLQGNSTILLSDILYWVFWAPCFFRRWDETPLKTWSMFLPAFQSVCCYGETFLKGGNKSCLLEGCQNPGKASGCTNREAAKSINSRWDSDGSHTENNRATNGKQCLEPTTVRHGHSSGKPWTSIRLCKSWIFSEHIQELLGILTDTYIVC